MTSADLLLSSGFLAFARHTGVVQAIEERGFAIDAVVGTSSGALVGALWSAGHRGSEIERMLSERRPAAFFGFDGRLWRGAFTLDPFLDWLRARLPATFAGLPRPFAAGVMDGAGAAVLLTEGPLPEAVAASCAIPGLFAPVSIGDTVWRDGGKADRLMVGPWRAWRPGRTGIAHIVDRTAGNRREPSLDGLTVIRTPRSGASFWSLGDVACGVAVARERAAAALDNGRA